MQIQCRQCEVETIVIGDILGESPEAMQGMMKGIVDHCRDIHPELWKQYEESVKEVTKACAAIYSWMLFNGFVDIDSDKTSQTVKDSFEGMDELVDPLVQLLSSEDEDENEEDNKSEAKEKHSEPPSNLIVMTKG